MFVTLLYPPPSQWRAAGANSLSCCLFCGGKDSCVRHILQNHTLIRLVMFTTPKKVSFILCAVQQSPDIGAMGIEE